MKNLSYLLLAAVVLFFSCQTENIEVDDQSQATTTDTQADKGVKNLNASVSHSGQYAGFGYNPVVERTYPLAMDAADVYQSTHIPNPFSVSIEIIKTNKQLEAFVNKESSRVQNNQLFVSLGGDPNQLEDRLVLTENTTTVIARINLQRYKYITDGFPLFHNTAYNMLNQNKVSQFLSTYGPMYVESQILGADVYYFYTYRDTNFNSSNVTAYENKIKAHIQRFFGTTGGPTLTPAERQRMQNTLLEQGYYSSVSGFVPRVVTNTTEFQNEINRLQSYLVSYPSRASTVEMKFRPYSYMMNVPALRNEFNKKSKCQMDAEKWELLKADMVFIKNNTGNSGLRTDANNAINAINSKISASQSCGSSQTPSGNEYNSLKQRYANE